MRIAGYGHLEEFLVRHPQAKASAQVWEARIRQADIKNMVELKQIFRQASYVKPYTYFNLGLQFRLKTIINYTTSIVLIVRGMDHKEYDRE